MPIDTFQKFTRVHVQNVHKYSVDSHHQPHLLIIIQISFFVEIHSGMYDTHLTTSKLAMHCSVVGRASTRHIQLDSWQEYCNFTPNNSETAGQTVAVVNNNLVLLSIHDVSQYLTSNPNLWQVFQVKYCQSVPTKIYNLELLVGQKRIEQRSVHTNLT